MPLARRCFTRSKAKASGGCGDDYGAGISWLERAATDCCSRDECTRLSMKRFWAEARDGTVHPLTPCEVQRELREQREVRDFVVWDSKKVDFWRAVNESCPLEEFCAPPKLLSAIDRARGMGAEYFSPNGLFVAPSEVAKQERGVYSLLLFFPVEFLGTFDGDRLWERTFGCGEYRKNTHEPYRPLCDFPNADAIEKYGMSFSNTDYERNEVVSFVVDPCEGSQGLTLEQVRGKDNVFPVVNEPPCDRVANVTVASLLNNDESGPRRYMLAVISNLPLLPFMELLCHYGAGYPRENFDYEVGADCPDLFSELDWQVPGVGPTTQPLHCSSGTALVEHRTPIAEGTAQGHQRLNFHRDRIANVLLEFESDDYPLQVRQLLVAGLPHGFTQDRNPHKFQLLFVSYVHEVLQAARRCVTAVEAEHVARCESAPIELQGLQAVFAAAARRQEHVRAALDDQERWDREHVTHEEVRTSWLERRRRLEERRSKAVRAAETVVSLLDGTEDDELGAIHDVQLHLSILGADAALMEAVPAAFRSRGVLPLRRSRSRSRSRSHGCRIRQHHGPWTIGRAARVQGLKNAVDLNGRVGKLVDVDLESKRYILEFINGDTKRIKEENLESSDDVDEEYRKSTGDCLSRCHEVSWAQVGGPSDLLSVDKGKEVSKRKLCCIEVLAEQWLTLSWREKNKLEELRKQMQQASGKTQMNKLREQMKQIEQSQQRVANQGDCQVTFGTKCETIKQSQFVPDQNSRAVELWDGKLKSGDNRNLKNSSGKRPRWKAEIVQHEKGMRPGTEVTICGLLNATEFNGRQGRCVHFDPTAGRWEVDVGGLRKNIRSANLELDTQVRHGGSDAEHVQQSVERKLREPMKELDREFTATDATLGEATECTSLTARRCASEEGMHRMDYPNDMAVELIDGGPEADTVQILRSSGDLNLCHRKCICPETDVTIRGLVNAPELNGRTGRCILFEPTTGRWEVDIGGVRKNIRPMNLEPDMQVRRGISDGEHVLQCVGEILMASLHALDRELAATDAKLLDSAKPMSRRRAAEERMAEADTALCTARERVLEKQQYLNERSAIGQHLSERVRAVDAALSSLEILVSGDERAGDASAAPVS